MANEIVTEIRLELQQFASDLAKAKKEAEIKGKESGEGLGNNLEKGLLKSVFSIKSAFVAAAAAIGSAFTLKEAISAASQQEEAIQSLNIALALNGNYSEEASKHIQDLASSLQSVTTAGDEVIVKGAALITTLGGIAGPELDRATKASLDLAAALGMDVDTAFNLVGKAAAGNVGSLSRYGIQVKDTGDNARDFAVALAQLEQRFGGFAQAQAQTFQGALTQTKNIFGDILEVVGDVIIKSPTMIAIIRQVGDGFSYALKELTAFTQGRDLIKESLLALVEFGTGFTTYVVAPLEFGFKLIKTGILGLATAFQGLTTIMFTINEAIVTQIAKPILEFQSTVLGSLVSIIDKDLGASIKNFVDTSIASLQQGLSDIQEVQAAALGTMTQDTSNSVSSLFDFEVSSTVQGFLDKTAQFAEQVKPPLKAQFQAISDAVQVKPDPNFFQSFAMGFKQAAGTMSQTAIALGKQFQQSISVGMVNTFAAFGSALAKGENALKAFGLAFLGVLGDLALQVASWAIATGIPLAILGDPRGYALIAAGAALAVLGGVLKGAAGAAGAATAPAAPAPGGGGVAASSDGGLAGLAGATDGEEGEVRQRQTQVVVNVQGNVFNQRETGLEIARVINDNFRSNGQSIVQAGIA